MGVSTVINDAAVVPKTRTTLRIVERILYRI